MKVRGSIGSPGTVCGSAVVNRLQCPVRCYSKYREARQQQLHDDTKSGCNVRQLEDDAKVGNTKVVWNAVPRVPHSDGRAMLQR